MMKMKYKNNLILSVLVVLLILLLIFYIGLFFTCEHNNGEELKVELLHLDGVTGPESIAFDTNGEGPYTGVSDGRILKWQGKENGWLEYAAVSSPQLLAKCRGSTDPNSEPLCGRPLGLEFSNSGDLFIADAYRGLLVVKPGQKFAVPVTNGIQLGFTNSLCFDKTGSIYFTDSSQIFQRRQYLSVIISGDTTGRLLKYNPKTKEVQVLLEGLQFPNGLTLSDDGSFLLFSETTTCRVMRYWLQGLKAGQVEVFATLPGFPDNINRSPRGGYWIALHSKRSKLVQLLLRVPGVKNLMLAWGAQFQRLSTILHRWGGGALAVRVSDDGEVLEYLEGFGGRKVRLISEVEERNGSLWVGSVLMPYVALYHIL